MDIHYLIYVSKAAVRIDEEEMLSIFESSRRNNKLVDVTGMLIYRSGNFMQMLEGPRKSVMQVYARIQDDPRHEGLVIVTDGESEKRVFPHWSMAAVPDAADLSLVTNLWPLVCRLRDQFTAATDHAAPVLGAFRALRCQLEEG